VSILVIPSNVGSFSAKHHCQDRPGLGHQLCPPGVQTHLRLTAQALGVIFFIFPNLEPKEPPHFLVAQGPGAFQLLARSQSLGSAGAAPGSRRGGLRVGNATDRTGHCRAAPAARIFCFFHPASVYVCGTFQQVSETLGLSCVR